MESMSNAKTIEIKFTAINELIWHKGSRKKEKKFDAIDYADNSMKVEPIESRFSCHLLICSVHVQSYTCKIFVFNFIAMEKFWL